MLKADENLFLFSFCLSYPQVKTLLVAAGIGRMAEAKAKGNAGAYAVSPFIQSISF